MDTKQKDLWIKIQNFQLDHANASFPFSKRLARENGWTEEYTNRVIEEYRRFLLMCCTTPKMVSPSHDVDEAWHLHLTYTRSYWTDLCKNTLGTDIHHEPTKGGTSEKEKHIGMYDETAVLYEQLFGEKQPEDIWKSTQQQFKEFHYEKVNRHQNWVIPKPTFLLQKRVALPTIALLGLTSIFALDAAFWICVVAFIVIVVGLIAARSKKGKKGGGSNSGGGFFGCGGGCSSCSSGCGGGCGGCG